jgi:hypothetical protein
VSILHLRAKSDASTEQTLPQSSPAKPGATGERLTFQLVTGRTSPLVTTIGWLFFALVLVFLCGQFWQGVNPQDEGEMLTYPWLVASGRTLYRDIWTMYPPAPFLILAALFKLGVPGLVAERGLGIVARVLAVLLFNRATTGSLLRFSWIAIPVTLSLMFLTADVSVAAYPWILGLPLVLLALLLLRSERLGLSALAFGLAGTFRLEFGIAGLVALVSLALLRWIQGDDKPSPWRVAIALAAGIALFYGVLDVLTGGRAIQQMVIDPILRIEPHRRVPIIPPLFGPFALPAAVVLFLGPPSLILLGLRRHMPTLVAGNLALCALLPQVVQDADWGHLFGVAALGVPWVLLCLYDLSGVDESVRTASHTTTGGVVASSRGAWRWLVAVGFSLGLAYASFVLIYCAVASPLSPASRNYVGQHQSVIIGSGVHMIVARNRSEARDERAVIAYLSQHATAHDSVFVAPAALRRMDYNMTALYYALAMQPASPYLEANPGLETQESVQRVIMHELGSCKWIVLWKDTGQRNAGGLGGPMLGRYIHANYRKALSTTTFEVLRRPTRSVSAWYWNDAVARPGFRTRLPG